MTRSAPSVGSAVVAVYLVLVGHCTSDPLLQRKVRQTGFAFGSQLVPGNVNLLQLIDQLPTSLGNSINAVCQPLTQQSSPINGCVFVPSLIEPTTNRIVSCRLLCPPGVDQLALQTIGGAAQPFVAANLDYLSTGQFTVSDQSKLDVSSGDSYFVFTPSTSTAAPVTDTSTSAAPTVTTTTLAPARTTLSAAQQFSQVSTCVDRRTPRNPACTFTAIDDDCSKQCCNFGSGPVPVRESCTDCCSFPAGSKIGQCIALGPPISGAFSGGGESGPAATCGFIANPL
ncbi:hypothetical protein RvY_12324 [Ramazzottius varieornatus]|uniref:Uncharacterized protein n=1 Tax=Ramazzottius varieornatus TaxID=947166 RepID=A0A1D1VLF4_RAMVA|nr:hypothetical protein RvY_12324 [Ramazzottius varieornatus]